MTNVLEPKRWQGPVLSFAQTQQLLVEMPKMLQHLEQQNEATQRLLKRQLQMMQKQVDATSSTGSMLGLVGDRLDTLTVEQKVTNLLLSELIAIHQTIIHDASNEVEDKRDVIRNYAYMKVLNGE